VTQLVLINCTSDYLPTLFLEGIGSVGLKKVIVFVARCYNLEWTFIGGDMHVEKKS